MADDNVKFRKIQVTSIKHQFKDELINMILSGKLTPGDPLPTERQLSADMGISKTVVHEGLRDLIGMGFLDHLSRRGIVVANYPVTGNIETLHAILNYHEGHVDARTAVGIVEFCEYVECPSMQRIAGHHSAKEIRTLEDLVEKVEQTSLDGIQKMSEAWGNYHRQIVYYSGNPLLPLMYSSMMKIGLPVFIEWCRLCTPETILRHLQIITGALGDGDAETAVRYFLDCSSDFKNYILASPDIFRPDIK